MSSDYVSISWTVCEADGEIMEAGLQEQKH